MSKIAKTKISTGIYWLEVPEAGLYVLCGCPADSIKHLMKSGNINTVEKCTYAPEDTSQKKPISTVVCETGPNAILLSDLSIQNGHFTNLAEFPVLQMLYRQGMLLPNHPNNTGNKPLIIGNEEVVHAQMQYIFRGNYGLSSLEEIMETGISREEAQEMMRLKTRFAFGTIHPSTDLLEGKVVDEDVVEVLNGVYVSRKATNVFEFSYGDEKVEVDLNLIKHQNYDPPYELEKKRFKKEYFSIIHTGEGDGWDTTRPCMSSLVCFQGKLYLIDAGPNIAQTLSSIGVDVNEIEGVFHTHGHDDHFSGLTTLIRTDHRIKYFATPLVRASVTKKLSALMSIDEDHFEQFFEVHDLDVDEWNDIDGLEVKPVFSPHPVETNIMFFKASKNGQTSTYAHLADLTSIEILQGMVTDDPEKPGINQEMLDRVQASYLTPAQVKKVDIGGGMIHGRAEDYRQDKSDKIILAHTADKLTEVEKEIGCDVPFGSIDLLLEGSEDYVQESVLELLKSYFPETDINEIQSLVNCERKLLKPKEILLGNMVQPEFVYLVLTGVVTLNMMNKRKFHKISSGSLVGDMPVVFDYKNKGVYQAHSHVEVLQIPATQYKEFISRNQLTERLKKINETVSFMHDTWLFCESISSFIKHQIAQNISIQEFKAGEDIPYNGLMLIYEGEVELTCNNCDKNLETHVKGEFFGEDAVLSQKLVCCSSKALTDVVIYVLDDLEFINTIPILRWKMLEQVELRSELRAGRR